MEIIFKSLKFFEKAPHHVKKASILLKMFSESLVIIEKASAEASISLKMSSKRLVIFIKTSHLFSF
jgi:hypothetical protein